jgi:hypothetical protein
MFIATPIIKNVKNKKYPTVLYSDMFHFKRNFAIAHHGAIAIIGRRTG